MKFCGFFKCSCEKRLLSSLPSALCCDKAVMLHNVMGLIPNSMWKIWSLSLSVQVSGAVSGQTLEGLFFSLKRRNKGTLFESPFIRAAIRNFANIFFRSISWKPSSFLKFARFGSLFPLSYQEQILIRAYKTGFGKLKRVILYGSRQHMARCILHCQWPTGLTHLLLSADSSRGGGGGRRALRCH